MQLTGLLFPEQRSDCWLRTRGLVIATEAFLLGVLAAWYGWTQRARVRIFHMAPYSPPLSYILVGLLAIVILVAAAHALPSPLPPRRSLVSRSAPSPAIVGSITCALALPWAAFVVGWGTGAFPTTPFPPVLAAGLGWACITFLLMRRWTSSNDWGDAHRYAVVFGGALASMLGGFLVFRIGNALTIDGIGKVVLNAAAVVGLIAVSHRRLRHSSKSITSE